MRRLRNSLPACALLFICPFIYALESAPSLAGFSIPVNLEFRVSDLELASDFALRDVRARCDSVVAAGDYLRCRGATLTAKSSPLGRISLDADIVWVPAKARWTVSADALFGESSMRIKIVNSDDRIQTKITLRDWDLSASESMKQTVNHFLPEHDVSAGVLDLSLSCELLVATSACELTGSADSLDINGVNVAESLKIEFKGSFKKADGQEEFEVDISLIEGAAYIEPGFTLGDISPGFFVEVHEPVQVSAAVRRLEDGSVEVLAAHIDHPNVVQMRFNGNLSFSSGPRWSSLDFSLTTAHAANLYQTYMQPIALDTVFGSLETAGGMTARIVGSDNAIDDFEVSFSDIYLDDENGRFALYGLNGGIKLHAGDEIRDSHLNWDGAAVYRIEFGAGGIDWTSSKRNLRVVDWQDVSIFDGGIRIDTLEIEDFSLDGTRAALSGTLTPITLSALTAAFDWMPLAGKISGQIPKLTYAQNRLSMEGDLQVNVFGGTVVLRELEIDQLFSTVPVLTSEIEINQLDLEALTGTFSFGNISGTLSGAIRNLILEAWRPISFDAGVATLEDDDKPHRISQQAVDNLGRLGAGTGTALSQGWLGLIPSYSYGQLGIRCQLVNGYCQMGGVEDAGDGSFYILTRGGILPPWIDVKGSGRKIKWQTLVDGIKQISQGNWELDLGS